MTSAVKGGSHSATTLEVGNSNTVLFAQREGLWKIQLSGRVQAFDRTLTSGASSCCLASQHLWLVTLSQRFVNPVQPAMG